MIKIQDPQAWLRIDNSDMAYINTKISLLINDSIADESEW